MKITLDFEMKDVIELLKAIAEGNREVKSNSVVKKDWVYSQYAKVFDESCSGWTKDPEYNMTYLRTQQRYANELLVSKGHLLLNDVYDMLGFPRTKAGQIVGWVYNKNNPIGDNFVRFGLENDNVNMRNFTNGYSNTVILDFNVDGDISKFI